MPARSCHRSVAASPRTLAVHKSLGAAGRAGPSATSLANRVEFMAGHCSHCVANGLNNRRQSQTHMESDRAVESLERA
jgi:hypothetical protein